MILALDVSTTTIGIALFEDLGDKGRLILLTEVSPKCKTKDKTEELFKKVEIFENEFLFKVDLKGVTKVIIEEPLLQSNNIYTIATLLKFNGMISKSVYDFLKVIPEYISSYDARKYAFPELMAVRKFKKDGTALTDKAIAKNKPVLFGDLPHDIDKKHVLWEKVAEYEPDVKWDYDKNKLKKSNYDKSDAYVVCLGQMHKNNIWTHRSI
jgi:RNase H-fold protein (predicted Holliday junction resolvase)